ncbi:MAG TPA: DUF4233 domain-containing protein [Terrimesophilobacter sp.]|nr:DUF4233 domain-containing protein [Terrimesophilobacter sp.]HRP98908.1 DUF4233 domain-containing protein [Terrimesophilobacter sp.]
MTRGTEPSGRRVRSASESLLSIVLGLEAFVIFFAALTVFGLRELAAPVAFGGGAVLIVAFMVAAYAMRFSWGVWLGWLLQAVLVSLGFVTPVLFAVAAVFVALWVFCFVTGRRLDARKFEGDVSTESAAEPN